MRGREDELDEDRLKIGPPSLLIESDPSGILVSGILDLDKDLSSFLTGTTGGRALSKPSFFTVIKVSDLLTISLETGGKERTSGAL